MLLFSAYKQSKVERFLLAGYNGVNLVRVLGNEIPGSQRICFNQGVGISRLT